MPGMGRVGPILETFWVDATRGKPYLVGGDWNMTSIFPYIGNNQPNCLIIFRGVETTNQPFVLRLVKITHGSTEPCLQRWIDFWAETCGAETWEWNELPRCRLGWAKIQHRRRWVKSCGTFWYHVLAICRLSCTITCTLPYLVGGLEHVLFLHIFWIIIPSD